MAVLTVALLLMALVGHAALCAGAVNRLHSVRLPRWLMDAITVGMFFLWALGWPILLVVRFWHQRASPSHLIGELLESPATAAYVVACWVVAALVIVAWVWRHWLFGTPAVLRHNRRQRIAPLEPPTGQSVRGGSHHAIARLPANESLALDVVERALIIPRLSPLLDGMSIVHLSDTHLTGRVGQGYFHEVVRRCNALQPDLVCITGDLIDKKPCLEWIPEVFGRLEGRYGRYAILGNHDATLGAKLVRQAVHAAGLTDLGGRWLEVAVRGQRVIVGGNEMPWLPPAPDLASAPAAAPDGPLRIVLAHSPDQLPWARANQVDLMLAGHTHGGQICLPGIGPLLTPSRWGVRYSAGTFHVAPTILHVTRGVSGVIPLRFCCAPEIVRLTLHCK